MQKFVYKKIGLTLRLVPRYSSNIMLQVISCKNHKVSCNNYYKRFLLWAYLIVYVTKF